MHLKRREFKKKGCLLCVEMTIEDVEETDEINVEDVDYYFRFSLFDYIRHFPDGLFPSVT